MVHKRRFGGEAGEILSASLHPSAFFTGATVGGMVLLLGWFLLQSGAARALPLVLQGLLSLILVRVALNSLLGTADGGVFASSGSTWGESVAATARLFLLNLVWSLPAVIVLRAPQALGLGAGEIGPAQAGLLLGLAVLPALFLIAAVAARSVSDLLDPAFWRALFAGRVGDVVTLYGIFLGGLTLAGMGSMLVATALGAGQPRWTFFLMLVAGSYSAGVFLLLLGRLVGGFVQGAEADAGARDGLPELDSPLADHPLGDPVGGSSVSGHRSAGSKESFASAREDASPRPGVSSTQLSDAAAAEGGPTAAWDAVLAEDVPAADASSSRRITPVAADGEPRRVPRTERLRANARRAEEDPEGALDEVERWIEQEGPHPLFLIRRSQLRLQRGDGDEAGLGEAIEAARRTGAVGALADLYLADPERFEDEGFEKGDPLKMAEALLAHRRPADAARLFLRELKDDPGSLAAVKGIIGIADRALERDHEIELTLQLLDDLDAAAPDHGFGDYVAGLREDAERRLARAT